MFIDMTPADQMWLCMTNVIDAERVALDADEALSRFDSRDADYGVSARRDAATSVYRAQVDILKAVIRWQGLTADQAETVWTFVENANHPY